MPETEEKDEIASAKAIRYVNQQILLKLDTVLEEVKKCVRRVDQLQKTSDLIYEDRNILEDIQTNLIALREGIHINREHQERVIKDVKAEVIEQGLKVEEKVEKVKNTVEQKVENTKKSVEENIGELVQNIEKKSNIVIVKEGLLSKFKRFLI